MSRATTLAYALLLVTLATLFWPALCGKDRLAFRDTGHFYTPLYEYVADRQREAWFPLWNPFDMTGIPLAGETTTALFYPPRWIVFSLAPSAESAIAWYATIHLVWSAIAVHLVARTAGAKSLGCAIAILAYPLSGPVFFQIHNLPFLVGASWLPLAIGGMLRLRRSPTGFWTAITGVSLAMPTLGGDPQTTVHAILFAIPFGIWQVISRSRLSWRRIPARISRILAAMMLSGLLAAPQLAASIDWAKQTDRVMTGSASATLAYSVPPWHWLELIVPKISGGLFPVYTRLSHLLPGDGSTWVITLYAGVIPALLFLHRYLNRPRRLTVWDALLPTGLVFAMAGPSWALGELCPGYSSFRYPAKWLPFVSLGLAIVAAKEATCLFDRTPPPLRVTTLKRLCLSLAGGLLCVATVSAIAASVFSTQFELRAPSIADKYWGPLDVSTALEQIGWSTLTSAIVSFALWLATLRGGCWLPILLIIIAFEMYRVSLPQIAMVNRLEESGLLQPHRFPDLARSMRTTAGNPWPSDWPQMSDPTNRLRDVSASERNTKFGRWHLSEPTAVFNSTVSLRSQRIESFWLAIDELGLKHIDSTTSEAWKKIDSWLGITERLIVTADNSSVSQWTLAKSGVAPPLSTSLIRWDRNYRPQLIAPQNSIGPMVSRLTEVIRDSPTSPLVEFNTLDSSSLMAMAPPSTTRPLNEGTIAVGVVSWEPESIQLKVSAEHSGLLSLKVFQDGNWTATLSPIDANDKRSNVVLPVANVDFLFMGCIVPAGQWKLAFHYDPWWLMPSMLAAIVGCGCTTLAFALTYISRFLAVLPRHTPHHRCEFNAIGNVLRLVHPQE